MIKLPTSRLYHTFHCSFVSFLSLVCLGLGMKGIRHWQRTGFSLPPVSTFMGLHSLAYTQAPDMTDQSRGHDLQLHAWSEHLASYSLTDTCALNHFLMGVTKYPSVWKAGIQSQPCHDTGSLTFPGCEGLLQRTLSWSIKLHPSGF